MAPSGGTTRRCRPVGGTSGIWRGGSRGSAGWRWTDGGAATAAAWGGPVEARERSQWLPPLSGAVLPPERERPARRRAGVERSLLRGRVAGERAGPVEDLAVGGDESVAADQRGGDDESVARVRVEVRESHRANRCPPVEWQFDHSSIEERSSPALHLEVAVPPSSTPEPGHFPEGGGRDSGLPAIPGLRGECRRPRAEPLGRPATAGATPAYRAGSWTQAPERVLRPARQGRIEGRSRGGGPNGGPNSGFGIQHPVEVHDLVPIAIEGRDDVADDPEATLVAAERR